MVSISNARIRRLAVQVMTGILIDALLAAVCYRVRLNLASVSLIFLLALVLQALYAAFASLVAVAFVTAGVLDYFFIPPVLTWRIANPFDLLALAVFIITALVISRVASQSRSLARTAEERGKSLEQLYCSSERLLSLVPDTDVINEVLKTYRNVFGLKAACFFDGETARIYSQGQSDCISARTREAYISGQDRDDPVSGISVRCIRSRGKVIAAIGFGNLRDPELTARSLAGLTATALDRVRAFRTASRAAAEGKAEVFRAAILDALAHEFKTPLAVIVAAAGGLRESVLLPAERELAEEIETEACRLGRLTSRLLRRAELESRQLKASLARADLGSLVAAVVEMYARRHDGRRITLNRSVDEPVYVAADEELLSLALGQLLDNALKYSQPNSEIVVSMNPGQDSIRVRVWNSGSSISAADRRRVFERFFRGANAQALATGSGLGLYAATNIARAHGGTLTIEEAESNAEGVAFCLIMPFFREDPEYARIAAECLDC